MASFGNRGPGLRGAWNMGDQASLREGNLTRLCRFILFHREATRKFRGGLGSIRSLSDGARRHHREENDG